LIEFFFDKKSQKEILEISGAVMRIISEKPIRKFWLKIKKLSQ